MKSLVLVESPSKAKTIEKYLGNDFTVRATMGHVIDLPSKGLNVDIEKDYEPNFVVMDDKKKVISEIKKQLKKIKSENKNEKKSSVYLATDPDREGEAIAYHISKALSLKESDFRRITFHEITKEAITKALEEPGKIDQDLVQAQFARRILDRLVGYKLSSLIWTKMWYGLSAGRVQSPALRMIVEREEEIRNFKHEEYWIINADLISRNELLKSTKKDELNPEIKKIFSDPKRSYDLNDEENKKYLLNNCIRFSLEKIDSKKALIKNEKEADEIDNEIKDKDFLVKDIKEKIIKKYPYPPFTTSTLQQAGNNLFGFTSKRTMDSAQRLYQAGLITYMRTDSVNLASKAVDSVRSFIKKNYGNEYLPEKTIYYRNKARISQEAHEAIRPTDFSIIKIQDSKIKDDDKRLYEIIWKRTVACQMNPKKISSTSIISYVKGDKRNYEFKANFSKVIFDGWSKAFNFIEEKQEEISLPYKVDINSNLVARQILNNQKFTQPKARYTEATLIKALEAYGIGRPSTYSAIISTILARKYVEKIQKALKPTDVGELVCSFLKKHFINLVDYDYTANVEQSLDDIATGKKKYIPFIDSEYKSMIKIIDKVKKDVKKEDVVIIDKSEEKCDKCGSKMFVKVGRYGKFYSCSRFPECDGIKSFEKETDGSLSLGDSADANSRSEVEKEKYLDKEKYVVPNKCEKCGGEMILKKGRFGFFWSCKNYPKCKNIFPITLQRKCPDCNSNLVERKGRWGSTFIGCSSYPKCKYIENTKKKSSQKKDLKSRVKANHTKKNPVSMANSKKVSRKSSLQKSAKKSPKANKSAKTSRRKNKSLKGKK